MFRIHQFNLLLFFYVIIIFQLIFTGWLGWNEGCLEINVTCVEFSFARSYVFIIFLFFLSTNMYMKFFLVRYLVLRHCFQPLPLCTQVTRSYRETLGYIETLYPSWRDRKGKRASVGRPLLSNHFLLVTPRDSNYDLAHANSLSQPPSWQPLINRSCYERAEVRERERDKKRERLERRSPLKSSREPFNVYHLLLTLDCNLYVLKQHRIDHVTVQFLPADLSTLISFIYFLLFTIFLL